MSTIFITRPRDRSKIRKILRLKISKWIDPRKTAWARLDFSILNDNSDMLFQMDWSKKIFDKFTNFRVYFDWELQVVAYNGLGFRILDFQSEWKEKKVFQFFHFFHFLHVKS